MNTAHPYLSVWLQSFLVYATVPKLEFYRFYLLFSKAYVQMSRHEDNLLGIIFEGDPIHINQSNKEEWGHLVSMMADTC